MVRVMVKVMVSNLQYKGMSDNCLVKWLFGRLVGIGR